VAVRPCYPLLTLCSWWSFLGSLHTSGAVTLRHLRAVEKYQDLYEPLHTELRQRCGDVRWLCGKFMWRRYCTDAAAAYWRCVAEVPTLELCTSHGRHVTERMTDNFDTELLIESVKKFREIWDTKYEHHHDYQDLHKAMQMLLLAVWNSPRGEPRTFGLRTANTGTLNMQTPLFSSYILTPPWRSCYCWLIIFHDDRPPHGASPFLRRIVYF
jgi:hypothetical protein